MAEISSFFKRYPFAFPLLLMAAIFFLSLRPIFPDTWFHITAGQYLLKYGIFHKDIFSFAAYGREWYPYEWFFQVTLYIFQNLFGVSAIPFFGAFFSALSFGVLYRILRSLFKLNPLFCAWIISFCYLFTFGFYVDRPQVFGLLFFLINLGLILDYLYHKKNLLFLSIPITLLWANTHGSIILDVYLFASYAGLVYIKDMFFARTGNTKQWPTLTLYTLITAVTTILPPLGTLQYRLLYLFWQYHTRLANTIIEWKPITDINSLFQLSVFICIALLICGLIVLVALRKKLYQEVLWLAPLSIFIILPFFAYRNILYTFLAFAIMLGFLLSQLRWTSLAKLKKAIILLFFGVTFLFLSYASVVAQHTQLPDYTPIQAAQFIQKYNIQGNMLNDFGDGAYLLHTLYPSRKVFMDLRFDLYACCEMSVYDTLLHHANDTDATFSHLLYQTLLNKYSISYALIQTKEGTLTQRIGQILQNDPKWNLVYWDDRNEIFVRQDGKNMKVLKQFGTKVATPYGLAPFQPTEAQQAFLEYQKMIQVTDSARSRNGLGYVYIVQKNYPEAEAQFEKAILLDPQFDLPYISLADLLVHEGNASTATILYEAARKINPQRAITYISLAQVYIQYQQNPQKAQAILLQGLQSVVTIQDRELLQNALLQIQKMQSGM